MLARIRKSAENKDSGFTLIELLVVMIIIGILAAIAIPAFLSQKTKAKETSAKSDATNVSKDIAAAIVDGDMATAAGATLNAGPPQTVTLKYANTALGTVTVSPRLTSGNKINAVTASGTAYCVEVQAYESDGTTAIGSAWKATDSGLVKGNC